MIISRKNKFFLELKFYAKAIFFAALVFFLTYLYLDWQKLPNILNKAVADSATLLISLSMLMSALAYFFNFADRLVIYRKYIGVVGFFFALYHLFLSRLVLQNLLNNFAWQNWQWPILTGLLAFLIFALMAIISNQLAIRLLGAKLWRLILRTGYLGLILVLLHVFLLKSARWLSWLKDGMQTPPALSLIVTILILLVVLVRIVLEWSLRRRRRK